MNFDDKLKFFQPKSDKNNTEIIKKKLESFNKAQEKKLKNKKKKRSLKKNKKKQKNKKEKKNKRRK